MQFCFKILLVLMLDVPCICRASYMYHSSKHPEEFDLDIGPFQLNRST